MQMKDLSSLSFFLSFIHALVHKNSFQSFVFFSHPILTYHSQVRTISPGCTLRDVNRCCRGRRSREFAGLFLAR